MIGSMLELKVRHTAGKRGYIRDCGRWLLKFSERIKWLFKYDFNLQPIRVLATAWDASPDGKMYTFKLRENVR